MADQLTIKVRATLDNTKQLLKEAQDAFKNGVDASISRESIKKIHAQLTSVVDDAEKMMQVELGFNENAIKRNTQKYERAMQRTDGSSSIINLGSDKENFQEAFMTLGHTLDSFETITTQLLTKEQRIAESISRAAKEAEEAAIRAKEAAEAAKNARIKEDGRRHLEKARLETVSSRNNASIAEKAYEQGLIAKEELEAARAASKAADEAYQAAHAAVENIKNPRKKRTDDSEDAAVRDVVRGQSGATATKSAKKSDEAPKSRTAREINETLIKDLAKVKDFGGDISKRLDAAGNDISAAVDGLVGDVKQFGAAIGNIGKGNLGKIYQKNWHTKDEVGVADRFSFLADETSTLLRYLNPDNIPFEQLSGGTQVLIKKLMDAAPRLDRINAALDKAAGEINEKAKKNVVNVPESARQSVATVSAVANAIKPVETIVSQRTVGADVQQSEQEGMRSSHAFDSGVESVPEQEREVVADTGESAQEGQQAGTAFNQGVQDVPAAEQNIEGSTDEARKAGAQDGKAYGQAFEDAANTGTRAPSTSTGRSRTSLPLPADTDSQSSTVDDLEKIERAAQEATTELREVGNADVSNSTIAATTSDIEHLIVVCKDLSDNIQLVFYALEKLEQGFNIQPIITQLNEATAKLKNIEEVLGYINKHGKDAGIAGFAKNLKENVNTITLGVRELQKCIADANGEKGLKIAPAQFSQIEKVLRDINGHLSTMSHYLSIVANAFADSRVIVRQMDNVESSVEDVVDDLKNAGNLAEDFLNTKGSGLASAIDDATDSIRDFNNEAEGPWSTIERFREIEDKNKGWNETIPGMQIKPNYDASDINYIDYLEQAYPYFEGALRDVNYMRDQPLIKPHDLKASFENLQSAQQQVINIDKRLAQLDPDNPENKREIDILKAWRDYRQTEFLYIQQAIQQGGLVDALGKPIWEKDDFGDYVYLQDENGNYIPDYSRPKRNPDGSKKRAKDKDGNELHTGDSLIDYEYEFKRKRRTELNASEENTLYRNALRGEYAIKRAEARRIGKTEAEIINMNYQELSSLLREINQRERDLKRVDRDSAEGRKYLAEIERLSMRADVLREDNEGLFTYKQTRNLKELDEKNERKIGIAQAAKYDKEREKALKKRLDYQEKIAKKTAEIEKYEDGDSRKQQGLEDIQQWKQKADKLDKRYEWTKSQKERIAEIEDESKIRQGDAAAAKNAREQEEALQRRLTLEQRIAKTVADMEKTDANSDKYKSLRESLAEDATELEGLKDQYKWTAKQEEEIARRGAVNDRTVRYAQDDVSDNKRIEERNEAYQKMSNNLREIGSLERDIAKRSKDDPKTKEAKEQLKALRKENKDLKKEYYDSFTERQQSRLTELGNKNDRSLGLAEAEAASKRIKQNFIDTKTAYKRYIDAQKAMVGIDESDKDYQRLEQERKSALASYAALAKGAKEWNAEQTKAWEKYKSQQDRGLANKNAAYVRRQDNAAIKQQEKEEEDALRRRLELEQRIAKTRADMEKHDVGSDKYKALREDLATDAYELKELMESRQWTEEQEEESRRRREINERAVRQASAGVSDKERISDENEALQKRLDLESKIFQTRADITRYSEGDPMRTRLETDLSYYKSMRDTLDAQYEWSEDQSRRISERSFDGNIKELRAHAREESKIIAERAKEYKNLITSIAHDENELKKLHESGDKENKAAAIEARLEEDRSRRDYLDTNWKSQFNASQFNDIEERKRKLEKDGLVFEADIEDSKIKKSLKDAKDAYTDLINAQIAMIGVDESHMNYQRLNDQLDKAQKKFNSLGNGMKDWSEQQRTEFSEHRAKEFDRYFDKLDMSKIKDVESAFKSLIKAQDKASRLNLEIDGLKRIGADASQAEAELKDVNDEIDKLSRKLDVRINVKDGTLDGTGKLNIKQQEEYNDKLRERINLEKRASDIAANESREASLNRLIELEKKMANLRVKRIGKEDTLEFAEIQRQMSDAKKEAEALARSLGIVYKENKQGTLNDEEWKEYSQAVSDCEKKVKLAKQSFEDLQIKANAKLELDKQSFLSDIDLWAKKNTKAMKLPQYAQEIDRIRNSVENADKATLKNLRHEFRELGKAAKIEGVSGLSVIDNLKHKIKEYASYTVASIGIMEIVDGLRMMAQAVLEVDTAMTGLYRVTDLTADQYDDLYDKMVVSAKEYGRTLTDTINATSDWVKAGFDDVNIALQLSEITAMYQNISDLDYDTASENLITAFNGFKDQFKTDFAGDDVAAIEHITDVLNQLDNEFAITSAGLGESLNRSASAMQVAGNTFEETAAMAGAITEVTQDPEKAGSALKILSLRLRGMKGQLQELGEEVDDNVESISKMQTQILNLTGGKVNIFNADGSFKSTYEIMDGIADVWDELSSVDQADLLETIAGKNRANEVSALITAWEQAEAMKESALNSVGSAAEENATKVDSLQGRVNALTAAWQAFANVVMSSDFLKTLASLATGLLDGITKIFDGLGTVPTLLTVATAGLSAFKNFGMFKKIEDEAALSGKRIEFVLTESLRNIRGKGNFSLSDDFKRQLNFDIDALQKYAQLVSEGTGRTEAYHIAMQDASKTAKEYSKSIVDAADASGEKFGNTLTSMIKEQRQSAVALQAQEKSFKNYKNIIAGYNDSMNSAGLTQAQFAEAVSRTNPTLGKYLSGLNGAEAKTGSYIKTLAKTKLAMFGVELGAIAMNAAMTMGISLAIDALIKLVDALHTSKQEYADMAKEAVSTFDEQNNAAKNAKKTIEEVSESYEELSEGVNTLTNENISLSSDEYEEYLDIVNQIADAVPSLVKGYDSQGNAVLSCAGNVDKLTEAYKKMKVAANDALLSDAVNVFKTFADSANKIKGGGWNDSTLLNWSTDLDLTSYKALSKVMDDTLGGDISQRVYQYLGATDEATAEIAAALMDAGYEYDGWATKDVFVKNVLTEDPEVGQRILRAFEAQIEPLAASMRTVAEAHISSAFLKGDYKNISEDMQAMIENMIPNLSFDFFSGFIGEDGKFNAIEFYTEMDAILNAFNSFDDEQQRSLELYADLHTKYNNGEISLGEYLDGVNSIEQIINEALPDNVEESFKIAIGLDTTDIEADRRALIDELTKGSLSEDVATSFVDGLTGSQMHIALEWISNGDVDVSNMGVEGLDELHQRIEDEEERLESLAFTVYLDVQTEMLDNLNTAVGESLSGTGLSAEGMVSVTSMFEGLDGYDPSKLFERTANGIRLNTDEFRKLNNEYKNTNMNKLENKLSTLADDYYTTSEKLYRLEYGTQEYNDTLADLESIEANINATEQLMSQYEGLTSAYNEWQMAEAAGSQRNMYESIISGFENIEDEISRGWFDDGTIEFLELMTGKDLSSAGLKDIKKVWNGLDKTIKHTTYSVKDFFTTNEDGESTSEGVYNFLDAIGQMEEEKFGGLDVVKRDKKGNIIGFDFQIVGGDKAIADALGISEELVQIMLRAADDAGFVISMDGTYQQLDVLKAKAQEAAESLNKTLKKSGKEGFNFDFNADTIKEIEPQLNKANEILDGFRNKDGKINMELEGAEEAYTVASTLQSMLDKLKRPTYMELEVNQVEKELQEPLLKLHEYQRLVETEHQLKLSGADTSKLEEDKEKIITYLSELDPEIQATLGLVDDNGNPLTPDAIREKVESGELVIDATVDIQLEMDNKLGILVDKALLEAGLIDEEEFEKRVNVYLGVEVENDDAKSDVEDKTEEVAESGDKTVETKTDVDVNAGEVDTSDVEDTISASFREYDDQEVIDVDINTSVIGKQNVESLVEYLGTLDDKEIQVIAEAIGRIDVEKLREVINGLDDKTVEAIAKAIGTGDVKGLEEIINGLDDKTVQAIAQALGYNDVDELKTAVSNMDDKTVQAVAQALGITDVQTLIGVLSMLDDKTVQAIAEAIGKGDVQALVDTMANLRNKTVTATVKTVYETGALLGKKAAAKRTGSDLSPVDGTAHAYGSAFASGTAFRHGDWGVKGSGVALGGELGQEIVVRDGKYFTIGDEGAEFFKYKPNDIIFNAAQTRELFEKGKLVNGKTRGRAIAGGTAFAGGSTGSVSDINDDPSFIAEVMGMEFIFSVQAEGFDQLNAALEESASAAGLSFETMAALGERYKDIEGFDPAKLFIDTGNGIRFNQQELKRLENEYLAFTNLELDASIEALNDQYALLTEQLYATTDPDLWWQIYEEREAVAEQYYAAMNYKAMLGTAESAYNPWLNVETYEDIANGVAAINEELAKGYLSDDSKSLIDFISPKDMIAEGASFDDYIAERDRLFENALAGTDIKMSDIVSLDEDGEIAQDNIHNFFLGLQQAFIGEIANFNEATGKWSYNLSEENLQRISEAWGMSVESLRYIMQEAMKYGFDIDLTGMVVESDFAAQFRKELQNDFKFDIEAEVEGLEIFKTALEESASASGLTYETITALEERYKDLEGFDLSRLLERTANGFKLNREEASKLEAQYQNTVQTELQAEIDRLTAERDELTQKIIECTDAEEAYRLAAERDIKNEAIADRTKELALYKGQLAGATGALQRFYDAQSMGEDYDNYVNVTGSREGVESDLSRGVLSNASKAYIDLISPRDLAAEGATIDEYISEWEKSIDSFLGDTSYKFADVFSLDENGDIISDGVHKFFLGMQHDFEGSIAKFDEETGKWTYDFSEANLQMIQDKWGMSIDEIQLLLESAASAGYNVDWSSIGDALEASVTESDFAIDNRNVMFEFKFDFDKYVEGLEIFKTALEESASASGLSQESIDALTERYKDLEGFDAAKLFEKTAQGIKVNQKEVKKLESQYRKGSEAKLAKQLDTLSAEYKSLTYQIDICTDAEKRASLYAQRDIVAQKIQDMATLQSQIEGTTSAYQDWADAQAGGKQSDNYTDVAENLLPNMEELYRTGYVGTAEFRAGVEYMTGKDTSLMSIDDIVALYLEAREEANKHFAAEDDEIAGSETNRAALYSLEKLESLGYASQDESGRWTIGIDNIEEAAQRAGMSVDMLVDILNNLDAKGFEIDYVSSFDDMKTHLEEVEDYINIVMGEDYDWKFGTGDIDLVNSQLESTEDLISRINANPAEFGLSEEEAQEVIDRLREFMAVLLGEKQKLEEPAIMDVKVNTEAAKTDLGKNITLVQQLEENVNDLEKSEYDPSVNVEKAQKNIETIMSTLFIKDGNGAFDVEGSLAQLGVELTPEGVSELQEAVNNLDFDTITRLLGDALNQAWSASPFAGSEGTGTDASTDTTGGEVSEEPKDATVTLTPNHEAIDTYLSGIESTTRSVPLQGQGNPAPKEDFQPEDGYTAPVQGEGTPASNDDFQPGEEAGYTTQVKGEGNPASNEDFQPGEGEGYTTSVQGEGKPASESDFRYPDGSEPRQDVIGEANAPADDSGYLLDGEEQPTQTIGADPQTPNDGSEYLLSGESQPEQTVVTNPQAPEDGSGYLLAGELQPEQSVGAAPQPPSDGSGYLLPEGSEPKQIVTGIPYPVSAADLTPDGEVVVDVNGNPIGVAASDLTPAEEVTVTVTAEGIPATADSLKPEGDVVVTFTGHADFDDEQVRAAANVVDDVVFNAIAEDVSVNVGINPEDQTALDTLIASVDKLQDKTITITVNHVSQQGVVGTPPIGLVGTQTHHQANGTARAFAHGSWGIHGSGTALVGELGQELLVRDGRFYTIGDNGAEFIKYKANDIIFNAGQTKQLFEQGKIVNGRTRGILAKANGTAFAEGNAFHTGANGGGLIYGEDGVYVPFVSGGSSGDGSGGGSGDAADEFLETIDWIEVAIDRIERAISRLDLKASSIFKKWATRNNALVDQIELVRDEIDLQIAAAERYLEEANSVGLSEEYAKKVRNGEINIEDITDESLKEQIDEYQEWYEKFLDCSDAAEELKETVSELYQQRFDNVTAEFEGILGVIEHEKSMLEEFINQSEAQAWLVSAEYYNALAANERKTIAELEEQKAEQLAALNDAVANGGIEMYSEAWYEMVSSVDETTLALEEANTQLLEYAQTIQELDWEMFDLLQDKISQITTETEFLIDLLSSDELYDDKGQLTDSGMSTMGMHGVNYNVYMAQADQAAAEVARLDKELAEDPYDQDLIDRRQEMLELQQEMILAAQDEKEAIRDMVEEGIELELDALQELIDKRNEALDSQKDLYDYQKKVKEQTEEIAALEKQMAAYAGDDSEETRAKVQELKVSLEEANQELEETEYDRYIADQEVLLDELYLEYETILNERLDNLELLITDMVALINGNSTVIGDNLTAKADDVGYTLSESMKTIWNTDDFSNTQNSIANGSNVVKDVITMYGEKFSSAFTTTNDALKFISTDLASMIGQLNKIAKTNVKTAAQSSAAKSKEASGSKKPDSSTTTTTKPTASSSSGDGKPKIGDKVKFVSGQYFYDSQGKRPLGSHYLGKEVYITGINEKNWATHPYHISTGNKMGSGDLGWLKLNQLSGYASGKKNLMEGELAWTQENGQEFIIRPSDGAVLTPIAKGDSVLSAAATNNLWDMANNPADFIKDNLGIGDVDTAIGNGGSTNISQNIQQVTFSLPNVKNYEQLLTEMQRDKNFERLILSMTVDQIAGKSSLTKGKSIR